MIRELLERAPRDVNWRDRAIRLLLDCGDEEGAVAAARAGVSVYPRGAYLWFLLGTTINRLRRFAQPGEIEACFRRSLALNSVFFDAADQLSILLVEQRRYEDSEQVMQNIRPRLGDSSTAAGPTSVDSPSAGEESRKRVKKWLLDGPGLPLVSVGMEFAGRLAS